MSPTTIDNRSRKHVEDLAAPLGRSLGDKPLILGGHRWPIRPLVVEFRDEVYVAVRAVLRRHGILVMRLGAAGDVAFGLRCLQPDLVLANSDMRNVSAHLKPDRACQGYSRTTRWLYTARREPSYVVTQSNELHSVFAYGGNLFWLLNSVERQLDQALSAPCDVGSGNGKRIADGESVSVVIQLPDRYDSSATCSPR